MLTDFFPKPLQGSLLRRFRARIMNIDPRIVYHSATGRRSVLENNDRRNTDRCNAITDDTKDKTRRIMDSGDVLDGSVLEDIDRRSTARLTTTTDDG
jgi:hypothetical protein